MPESGQSNALLKQRIDELERLLNGKKGGLYGEPATDMEQAGIPILDELASDSDFENDIPVMEDIIQSGDEFSDVTDKLEQKFIRKLDQLVMTIKGNLKQNIRKELRMALNNRNAQDRDKKRPDKSRG